MKIKLNSPVAEISGAIGGSSGIVSGKWRGVMVARSNAFPNNPATQNQKVIRGYQGSNAALFKTISAEQKQGWEEFAEKNTTKIMGQNVCRPAISEFCRVNNLRAIAGQGNQLDAPGALCPFEMSCFGGAGQLGPDNYLIMVFRMSAFPAAGSHIMVKVTAPLPSGNVVPQPNEFRLIETVQNATSIPEVDWGTFDLEWNDTWTKFKTGDYVGISVTAISEEWAPGRENTIVTQLQDA